MRTVRFLAIMSALLLLITGCQNNGEGTASNQTQIVPTTYRAEDFVGKTIAIWAGTIFDKIVTEHIGETNNLYFNGPAECIEAVKSGRAYATLLDEPLGRNYAAKNSGVTLLYPLVTKDEYGFVFGKDKSELRHEFNEFLTEIKADGTYDELVKRWIDTAIPPEMKGFEMTGERGTIRLATSGINDPFSFMQNGKIAGFDIEIAYRFAEWAGYNLDVQTMDWGGMIPAVQSGKVDFAGDLVTITEERKEFIDFSDPHYIGGAAVIIYNQSVGEVSTSTFRDNLEKSFTQNLIVENRWKMVVNGLGTTLVISVFSFIAGTLIGFLICLLRMSRNKLLQAIASVYITLLRGTPIVVLLMITYYIIFAGVNINPVVVAIIAFGMNSGAFIGEIVRSAIQTVDKGQIEAARSMGFSKVGAFFTVTFPQAARVALPVYKSEFISLIKSTAVVGYIAIADLTRAGDIIRSRTYDAFFPLIIVALVYLIATGVMVWCFEMIEKMMDRRQRRGAR